MRIESAAVAPDGTDGITYLTNAIHRGIETPLTAAYKAEILKQTKTLSLEEALKQARESDDSRDHRGTAQDTAQDFKP